MGNRSYPAEVKLECIHMSKEEHLSTYEIARRMDIEAETNVRRWLELYDEHGEEWFLKEQRGPKRKTPYSELSKKRNVYKEFMIDKFGSVDSDNGKAYRTAFNNCPSSLYSVKFIDLRHKSLQKIIDDSDKNYPTLKKIITLFHQMYKYAMKTDYVLKDYSAQVTASKYKDRNPNALDRKIFSNEEIQTLWKHSNNKYIQMILILIYTGLRITTLLELKKSEVHIDERWFHIAKDKTEASIRDVPIAEAILPFFKSWYSYNDSEFMFTTTDNKPLFYRNYRDSYFDNLLAELGMEHKPHDTRHTCSTLLKQAGIPLIERKNILGHEIKDITEDVYTHVPINDLIPCVDKIHDVVMEKELA